MIMPALNVGSKLNLTNATPQLRKFYKRLFWANSSGFSGNGYSYGCGYNIFDTNLLYSFSQNGVPRPDYDSRPGAQTTTRFLHQYVRVFFVQLTSEHMVSSVNLDSEFC
jgi:hypothetical protein